jgi:hypothetical protein
VRFTSQHATVSVVNALQQPTNTVQGVGSAQGMYTVPTAKAQIDSYPFQGNGQQVVWVNADSVQDSQSAAISLQSVAARSRRESHRVSESV